MSAPRGASTLLEVRALDVEFATRDGLVPAVRDVSYRLAEGETLGIVGESGSGKSVTQLAILGLLPENARVHAERIAYQDRDLLALSARQRRELLGRELAIVFQDPATSLHPLLPIGLQLTEVLEARAGVTHREARRRAARALAEVGIAEPEARLAAYAHELSGGMRQRVMIAMALLLDPRLLVADEPTTALDVTLQAQVLDLFRALQKRRGSAIAFVTHSLGVVAGLCDRVLVMYAGRIVEEATTEELFHAPLHPYSRGLLACVPRLDTPLDAPLAGIPGAPTPLARAVPGCAFAPRCALAAAPCRAAVPPCARASATSARRSACLFAAQLAAEATVMSLPESGAQPADPWRVEIDP